MSTLEGQSQISISNSALINTYDQCLVAHILYANTEVNYACVLSWGIQMQCSMQNNDLCMRTYFLGLWTGSLCRFITLPRISASLSCNLPTKLLSRFSSLIYFILIYLPFHIILYIHIIHLSLLLILISFDIHLCFQKYTLLWFDFIQNILHMYHFSEQTCSNIF